MAIVLFNIGDFNISGRYDFFFRFALLFFLLSFRVLVAEAHPHVFVTSRSEVIFDDQGQIKAIRHHWRFDEFYSAYVIQGVADNNQPTRQQLAPLAKTNTESLAEFDYFTFGRVAGKPISFSQPVDYWLDYGSDKILTLNFTLPLTTPASASKAFSLQIYDPTYFVAFDFEEKDPISLVNAPQACSMSVSHPASLDPAESQKLNEAYFNNLSQGTNFGIKLAGRAIIACP